MIDFFIWTIKNIMFIKRNVLISFDALNGFKIIKNALKYMISLDCAREDTSYSYKNFVIPSAVEGQLLFFHTLF